MLKKNYYIFAFALRECYLFLMLLTQPLDFQFARCAMPECLAGSCQTYKILQLAQKVVTRKSEIKNQIYFL